ncbi:MAG: peptidase M2 family protein, partial [Enterobacterales bacterium]|nr:peptidase M2 family protein [Enterobacterales bacterium]
MSKSAIFRTLPLLLATFLISACDHEQVQEQPQEAKETAKEFIDSAEAEMLDVAIEAERAAWVNSNFITYDTDMIASEAGEKLTVTGVRLANESKQFSETGDYDTDRKLAMIRTALVLPAPSDPAKAKELSQLSTELNSMYGKGSYCDQNNQCASLGALSNTIATSRDPAELLKAWNGWRTIS